jgi:hypothetical protein
MIVSPIIKCYPLIDESSIVSCNPITSKYPCWSSFLFCGAGVARDQPVVGPKSFTTSGDPDPPLCENINDTLGLSIII